MFGTGWGSIGDDTTIFRGMSSRMDNVVAYQSPTFGGVTLYAQASLKNDSDNAGDEGSSKTDRYYGLVAVGNWGVFTAMLCVEQINYVSYAGSYTTAAIGTTESGESVYGPNDKVEYAGTDSDDLIGVEANDAYDFGIVKTSLTSRYFKDGAGYSTIIGNVDGYGIKLAAAAPVFGGTLQGLVGYMDAESADTTVTEDKEVSRYTVALTYDYPLSKRTKLYTAASYTKDDFKDNAVEDGSKDAKPSNTAFMMGIAHYF